MKVWGWPSKLVFWRGKMDFSCPASVHCVLAFTWSSGHCPKSSSSILWGMLLWMSFSRLRWLKARWPRNRSKQGGLEVDPLFFSKMSKVVSLLSYLLVTLSTILPSSYFIRILARHRILYLLRVTCSPLDRLYPSWVTYVQFPFGMSQVVFFSGYLITTRRIISFSGYLCLTSFHDGLECIPCELIVRRPVDCVPQGSLVSKIFASGQVWMYPFKLLARHQKSMSVLHHLSQLFPKPLLVQRRYSHFLLDSDFLWTNPRLIVPIIHVVSPWLELLQKRGHKHIISSFPNTEGGCLAACPYIH